MKRRVRVTRVVEAVHQNRVIVWLECHHKLSFPDMAHARAGAVMAGDEMLNRDCPFCPDPPPEVVRQEKTAVQLWKEAGEP